MDIVVTIPKSEYENDDLETNDMLENDYVQFWTLAKVPKRIEVGDRVYFIKHGQIESSMKVLAIENESTKTCLTTGRTWQGACQLTLDNLQDEKALRIRTKGFQGFRYKWWS